MPITAPARPLVWSDFNVIHTTDSHGWLLGHQKASPPEPNYSGDFGDFASFVSHMKEIALEKNVDLLLVDSGDLHDGTGLSDGYPAGRVDAHDSNEFIKRLPYDVMAIGNHELYVYNNTLDMYTNFAPHWKGRYLSSNANITVPDPNNANATVSVPVGNRYAKFKSRLGRRITSLGVIFDFTGNDNGTTVQKVEDMVKEQWFSEAIEEEPDLFLLVGHMPVSKDNWPTVFNAIRAVHSTTPILIFGGHTHIRDCTQFDGRSMALESGRYMETVGWMSVDLNDKYSFNSNKSDNLTFTRRYLDTNRVTYEYHTGRNSNTSFDTSLGTSMSTGLQELAERFDLNLTYGVAPHDFLLTRAPYPGNDSLLSLFIEQATPIALQLNNSRAGVPALFITNSGSQRFDILSGTFTKNDQITASPFADAFLYLPNITFSVAKQVLPALNAEGADGKRRKRWIHELYARGEVEVRYNAWLGDMNRREDMLARREAANATLGYVTTDSCPGAGDDTVHTPLPYYSTPDFVGSDDPDVSDDAEIDLVFVDFIENQLLGIVNDVQKEKTYTSADVQSYSPLLSNQLLGVYAEQKWN
ncbi:Metallo-dependent phosphatase-like protein [Phellopilus nigrolimitatus]|nr:Metallo-dependent phosphatase-like protein [Phellopilus nigrolimitatus]